MLQTSYWISPVPMCTLKAGSSYDGFYAPLMCDWHVMFAIPSCLYKCIMPFAWAQAHSPLHVHQALYLAFAICLVCLTFLLTMLSQPVLIIGCPPMWAHVTTA